MSWVLKENGEQIAISGGWNPTLFAKHTNTSFRDKEPEQTWTWQHNNFWLGWIDDIIPEPIPETNEQIANRLKQQLDEIERAEIMPRKTREIQIQLMEFLAAQQGITPEQLALNPAYAGMKEVDAICVELRAQIRALS
jgi:hypothetical protein